MEKLVTFWDEEQKRLAKQHKIETYQLLLGREKLPRLISGAIIKVVNIVPKELLKRGGYIELSNGSWIRRFDKEYRYHAYILDTERIEIHTDKFKEKNGRRFHIASVFMIKQEKQRLKKLVPTLSKEKRKYKNEILPIEKLREALAKMKEENEKKEGK